MRRKIVGALVGSLAIALAVAGCALSGSQNGASAGAANPQVVAPVGPAHHVVSAAALIHPQSGKYFGIEANGAPSSMSPVLAAAANVGYNPNIVGQYVSWKSPFDEAAAANAFNYGALYYMAWEPFDVTVQSIANGGSDAYITKFAEAVRAFGEPISLSFGHEMNGNWYPWGTTGASAADFVAAWRLIHNLFAKAGANNVIWVWNPNIINPVPDVQLQPYWPGNAYVDWVGLTGYFPTTGPDTFEGIYEPTISEVRKFTTKPFIIAETAVESGPSSIDSVHNLINGVKNNSDILGFIWFDYQKDGVDWSVGDRPDIRAAISGSLAGLPLVDVSK
jgi:mannan endo-1,4-beta-mannosidase